MTSGSWSLAFALISAAFPFLIKATMTAGSVPATVRNTTALAASVAVRRRPTSTYRRTNSYPAQKSESADHPPCHRWSIV